MSARRSKQQLPSRSRISLFFLSIASVCLLLSVFVYGAPAPSTVSSGSAIAPSAEESGDAVGVEDTLSYYDEEAVGVEDLPAEATVVSTAAESEVTYEFVERESGDGTSSSSATGVDDRSEDVSGGVDYLEVLEGSDVVPGEVEYVEVVEDLTGVRAAEPADLFAVDGGGVDVEDLLISAGDEAVEYSDEGGDSGGVGIDVLVDVQCANVGEFPRELFAAQPDSSLVYDRPVEMPEGIFLSMGFNRFLSVFGVPVVASTQVDDASLRHAAHIFAAFVDNDGDGIPDRPSSIQSVRDYQTVIGYVSGAEESDELWKEKYTRDDNEEFRKQFACNMHFFEQWASDATPDYYTAVARREGGDSGTCSVLEDVDFDWPLWYFPFTMTYYGYQEDLDEATLAKVEEVMEHAREEQVFFGNYPDDKEMETADFFVWSLLTKLGALECHCESDIIEEVWKICTAQGLKQFDEEWFDLLESIDGIPKLLPSGDYRSPALTINGRRAEEEVVEVGEDVTRAAEVVMEVGDVVSTAVDDVVLA